MDPARGLVLRDVVLYVLGQMSWRRHARWLGSAVAFTICLPNSGAAERIAPLRQSALVKRLSADEANRHAPVLIHGVVTQVLPEWWGFSLQDATDGVYVAVGKPLPPGLQVGQAVEVEGQTFAGNFAPVVKAENIRVLGTAPMPHAQRVNWPALATGACDNEYVEVQGIVRSAGLVEPPAWEWRAVALRLDLGGNFIWAYVRGHERLLEAPLVDGTVKVRGVCLVFSNSQRQFQGTALTVSQSSDVDLLQPGPRDQFEAPLQTIPHLFGFHPGSASSHRVRVDGIATLQLQGNVYVQQGSSGILVRTASAPKIIPGDVVEAVGFPAAGGFSTVLEDALVRVTGHGPEPNPRDVAADQILARVANAPAAPNAVLVSVSGRVLERCDRRRTKHLCSLVLTPRLPRV